MTIKEITRELNKKFEFMNLSSSIEFSAKYRLNKIYVLAKYVPSAMMELTLRMLHDNLDELEKLGVKLDIAVNDTPRAKFQFCE